MRSKADLFKTSLKKRLRTNVTGYLFISPWLLGLIFFTAGPIIMSFYYSFTSYNIFEPGDWVGIKNYIKIFTEDNLFWSVLLNTLFYVGFRLPLHIGLALLLAMALNRAMKGIALFRTAFYLPTVIPIVASAAVWSWILDMQVGLLKYVLDFFHMPMPNWFGSILWAKPAIILMSLWHTGTLMVIFLAGLQDIPEYLYEAVDIDGGSILQKFIHITIPMLTPTIFFTLVIDTINSFQVFAYSFILTNGGPLNSTLFLVLYIYRNAFSYFDMGYASSLAVILFFIILLLTLVILKFSKKWVVYERI